MLNKKARKLIGYDRLVKKMAAEISPAELEYMETKQLMKLLGPGYENWEFNDWYRLLVNIKQEQRKVEHEELTAEKIFNGLPWAAQQAAQEAVSLLIKKSADGLLFKLDETADMAVNILWNMFYCMGIDIKDTAQIMHEQKRAYSNNDLKENKLFMDFIEELRKRQWYKHGEVARLRFKE